MPSSTDKGNSKSAAKSAKAINASNKMASNKKKKKGGVPATSAGIAKRKQIPWLTVGAIVAVVALIAILGANLLPKYQDKVQAQKFVPTESKKDPSVDISGVKTMTYPAALHVQPTQRVAYDQSPPFGGPHDAVWATCTGVVYPMAIRTENAVHSLEHGAVWITYNPDKLTKDQISTLASKVDGQSYSLMSPYPGLDSPVSLQSWGHQLKVGSVDDPRIDEFITALRLNQYTYPEVGASCATVPGSFDPTNPPPFDATPPGADAVPMDGKGLTPDATEAAGGSAGGSAGGAALPSDLQLPTDLQLPSGASLVPAPALPAPAPAQ